MYLFFFYANSVFVKLVKKFHMSTLGNGIYFFIFKLETV